MAAARPLDYTGRMQKLLWLVLALATLSLGCIVPVHHGGPPPPGRHYRSNCRSECVQWGQRSVCNRRCRFWSRGVCMGWEQHCYPQQTCLRHGTVCR